MHKARIYLFIYLLIFMNALIFAYEPSLESDSIQNWEHGKIHSVVKLNMAKSGLQLPSDRNVAFELIDRYLPSGVKDIYLSLIVDSSHRLGNYLAEGRITLNDLNEIIKYGEQTKPAFSTDLSNAVVYVNTSIHEVAKLFIMHKTPYVPTMPPTTVISKAYSGIIIDARGSLPVHGEYTKEKLNPCIFPKIWNTDMSRIYDKNMIEPNIAKNQALVVYSSSLDESLYRSRAGANPLHIIAREIYGQNRTDPIISMEDSGKILSRPENLQLLREGKVVIICDPDMLRLRGPINPPDENYYFAYHDIELMLQKQQDKDLKLSNPKNIVTITMYDVRFIANKPDVLPEEMSKIDLIAEALLRVGPYAKFLIEGHTADLSRPEEEQILSVQRSERIADEIAKRGIARDRIATEGYGSTRPVAPSDTEKNMAKNRRVVITVIRE